MEAVLIDSVQNSLRHFMYRNAIFICERLCAEFPSEVNLQLLASCYLCNNQAYAAYQILKGTQMAQSRYLFALSCFRMDLLAEAEKALSPTHDSNLEVPNGAAAHYLLGLIYRYTDRRKSAVLHFKLALSMDPLFWAAYEELCLLGSAEEAAAVFGEAAVQTIHKQQQRQQHAFSTQRFVSGSEDHSQASAHSFEDTSSRQLKNTNSNSAKDAFRGYPGAVASSTAGNQLANCAASGLSFYNTPSPMASQLSGVAPPPVCKNLQQNAATASNDSLPRSTINTTLQAPRRKFVDEGKLRKISGRLFSDSGPRRSTRLAGEAGGNTNSTSTASTGNGTSHSTKYTGSSRLSNAGLRSVTMRKGQGWASESFEEGIRQDAFDDSRLLAQASVTPTSSCDARSVDQDAGAVSLSRTAYDDSRIHNGAKEILVLLRLLGEGYRLSCTFKCQDALDVYQKLPPKHYNTGWVLSQVWVEDELLKCRNA